MSNISANKESCSFNWFPGHMAKTRRIIRECLPSVDVIVELLDARIPYSSSNPDLPSLIGNKPCITLMNKCSLADEKINKEWEQYYNSKSRKVIFCDCKTGQGISSIKPEIDKLLSAKLEKYESKGMYGRTLKAMIVGIPNVGKSTLINKLAGSKKAKAEDRPGVTTSKQWVPTTIGLDLLDMPGILWPKFDEQRVGENLALTGAIKDNIMDIEELACVLCGRLRELYPEALINRYKLDSIPDKEEVDDYDLLELIGRKRGMLVSGGRVNTERIAGVLLNEFRGAQIGNISLERP